MARTTERNVALSELNMRGIIINADAGGQSKTVYASDSGCIFVDNEDQGLTTYTLPSVADCAGKWFWFYNGTDDTEIAVTGTTASKMYGPGSEGAATTMTTTTNTVGDSCIVFGDGSYYYLIPLVGTWV